MKLYQQDQGGIRVVSHREGHVRIPNYVYDLWLPLLGATAIGVYGTYCRLEMNGCVKKISLEDIANVCRISKSSLYKINAKLEECGFIKVTTPSGAERLMHWTTQIDIFDPPRDVSQAIIDDLMPETRSYRPLTTWLVDFSDVPPSTSEGSTRYADNVPPSTPMIEYLGLQPLEVEDSASATPSRASDEKPPKKPKQVQPEAVKVFRSKAHRFPRKCWWKEVEAVVGNDPASLERWGEVVYNWCGMGWNPTNVKGMLDCYKQHTIPGDYANGSTGSSNGRHTARGGEQIKKPILAGGLGPVVTDEMLALYEQGRMDDLERLIARS